MDSSLYSRPAGPVYFQHASISMLAKEGYLYKYSATYGLVIVASATAQSDLPSAIVLDGYAGTVGQSSVLMPGVICFIDQKASGTIARWQYCQQAADGTVIADAGSGNRMLVGIANAAAVTGDRFEMGVIAPIYIAA